MDKLKFGDVIYNNRAEQISVPKEILVEMSDNIEELVGIIALISKCPLKTDLQDVISEFEDIIKKLALLDLELDATFERVRKEKILSGIWKAGD